MKNEKLKVRKINMIQLSHDMRFSREIHSILRKIDDNHKAFFDFGIYPDNEDNINEDNYHDKRKELLQKLKERTQNYYRENLRRIVNTLKLEILFELLYMEEEENNFDLYEMENWDNLADLSREESIEKYIHVRFEVPVEVLLDKSDRYYAEICEFIKNAILEQDKAYAILKENINIISRQVIPHEFILGISDEENLIFSDECNPLAFDMMIYSAVVSILYEIEQQVLKELETGTVALDTKNTVYYLSKPEKYVLDNILRNMTIYITVQKVFNMLSGCEDKTPSSQVKEAITAVFEKLSKITLNVNHPQLLSIHYKNSEGNAYLLSVKETEGMRINNRKRNYALYLQEIPPLYDLAKRKKKLYSVDISMLDVPLENSIENIALKGYLLRQMVIAKSTRKRELIISYQKLYRSIGIRDSGRGMPKEEQNNIHFVQMNIRLKVKKCLMFWREHELIRKFDTKSTKKAIIYI